MSFWSGQHLSSFKGVALQTNDGELTYQELNECIETFASLIDQKTGNNKIVFLLLNNDLDSVIAYLACLRKSIVPLLLPSDIDIKLLNKLEGIYKPFAIFNSTEKDNLRFTNLKSHEEIHNDLFLLLSTSGSTGSPKLVRLSKENILSNAKSICTYLEISNFDKALCSMPLSYSFGLSVLNTHLLTGATTYLTNTNPFDKDFYEILENAKITSISGVPFFFNILYRTGFTKKDFQEIKTITQAGGAMPQKTTKIFADYAVEKDINFFVMYGQTEATARMSYYKVNNNFKKIGSIGKPIPGGKITISSDKEIIFSGENVMLGYAENRSDLAIGNKNNNVLNTGDLGHIDEDGFVYVIGRKKRFVKVAGSRYNLDDIENTLEKEFETSFMTFGTDDNLSICYADKKLDLSSIFQFLHSSFGLNASFIKLKFIKDLPLNSNGKKDYEKIKELSQ